MNFFEIYGEKGIHKQIMFYLCLFLFSEDMSEGLNDDQKELFDKWVSLTKEQKAIIEALINEFK